MTKLTLTLINHPHLEIIVALAIHILTHIDHRIIGLAQRKNDAITNRNVFEFFAAIMASFSPIKT